jgi:hypothetical protein
MTIQVYRIDRKTGVRTLVRRKRTVEPAAWPELFSRYPPCVCPRCSGRTTDRAAGGTQ